MLTVRSALMDEMAALVATKIAERIAVHPLACTLTGTVLIGTGSAHLVRATDARPRVIIPLTLRCPLTALGRAQLDCAEGIVLADMHEVALLRDAIVSDQTVVMPQATSAGPVFLAAASQDDSVEAWGVVAAHSALGVALGRTDTHEHAATPISYALAEAAIEAVVATSTAVANTSLGRG